LEPRIVLVAEGTAADGLIATSPGASRPAPDSGSEESPMRWLVSWLVAQVMPAVRTMPDSAASSQSRLLRLMATR
jgi:hypothetical protein